MHAIRARPPGPGEAVEIRSERSLTLPALLDESLRRHRLRGAFVHEGAVLRYGALDDHARALAAWLQAQGLATGDRVAVMLPNVAQLPVVVLGILRAGLVVVNLDPRLARRELTHQLRDSGARAIVACELAATALEGVLHVAPMDLVLLARPGDLLGPLRGPWANRVWRRLRRQPPRIAGMVNLAQALSRGRRMVYTPPPITAQSVALLQYTGGTTGLAKAAVLTHRNLTANILQCAAWQRPVLAQLEPGCQPVVATALPLHQIFGFTLGLLLGLHQGALMLLVRDAADTAVLARRLARRRVHMLLANDAQLAALLREPRLVRADWSALRLTLVGGTALTAATATRWRERTGCAVTECYGLTEASPAVSCNPAPGPGRLGSVGLPLPGTELRLLDDAGHEVPAGGAGEVAVRGPQVMAGYWQRPDETAAVMTPEGFLRTGDIGRFDESGHLCLLDRKNDLIHVGRFHVVPAEVEGVVAQLPGVRECAAVGVRDARVGEAVKVVVVKHDPSSPQPSAAEVHAHCEHHLTGYKRPQWVEFRPALPRSGLGQVLRRELRASG